MNKKTLALIATGTILATTLTAVGCSAQKRSNPVNEMITAVEEAVATEPQAGQAVEFAEQKETATTTVETTETSAAPTTETTISEAAFVNENTIRNVEKTSSKPAKKPAAKKTVQHQAAKATKPTKNTEVKTTVKPTSNSNPVESKLISEYDKQNYSSVVYVGTNANVKIDASNPKRCQVTIRVKSGKFYYEYIMSGKLNRKTGKFNYSNGEKNEYAPNKSSIKFTRQIFSGSQGSITFLTNGITWVDHKDNINKTLKLTRA